MERIFVFHSFVYDCCLIDTSFQIPKRTSQSYQKSFMETQCLDSFYPNVIIANNTRNYGYP